MSNLGFDGIEKGRAQKLSNGRVGTERDDVGTSVGTDRNYFRGNVRRNEKGDAIVGTGIERGDICWFK